MSKPARYEVHEHSYVSGPGANRTPGPRLVHSHEGGDRSHTHESTGPSCYAGARKFTAKPTGPQLPQRDRTDEENSFDIIFVGDAGAAASRGASGPVANDGTLLTAERLRQTFRMKVGSVTHLDPAPKRARRAR